MSPKTILSLINRPEADALGAIGIALLQVKNDRRLSLPDMGARLGRSKVQVSHYIAGEEQMGCLVLLRALNAWPELSDKLAALA